jgi:hypothetical protein
MFSPRFSSGKKLKDEAEKPFWISFADLMTALMVMFLLVMSVALLKPFLKNNAQPMPAAMQSTNY